MTTTMSLPTKRVASAGPQPVRWTCAEFHQVGDMGLLQGRQAMLIDGVILEVVAKPDIGIAVLKKVEPLTNVDIEKQRLVYAIDQQLRTAEVAKIGLGDLDDAHLAAAIKTVSEVYALPRTPSPDEVFSHQFLPAKAERMLPAH